MARQLNGANSGVWRGQGFGLAAEGQEQEAIAAWHAAGITGQEFIQRGEAARLAGDYLEAIIWYERAEKLDLSLLSSILYDRFLAQQALGDEDSAFDSLGHAVTSDHGWINPEIRFHAWHSWGVRLVEQQRNREAANGGGICLVLSDRKSHIKDLAQRLVHKGIESAVLIGDMSSSERQAVVAALGGGKVKVLLATAQLISEGFDCPELSTLFLSTPIRFDGRLLQCLGRVLRPAPGKDQARVYDYCDSRVGVLEHSAKVRQRVYERN